MASPTKHFSTRIPETLDSEIATISQETGRSKTDVVIDLLRRGLAQLEEAELAAGFALLADPKMQDMAFPTGAQLEAARIAD